MKSGIEIINEEQIRQRTSKGWTLEHDLFHAKGELACAAALYAIPEEKRHEEIKPFLWPFEAGWWKPSPENRIKELAKAGALIASEIDRLQYASKGDNILYKIIQDLQFKIIDTKKEMEKNAEDLCRDIWNSRDVSIVGIQSFKTWWDNHRINLYKSVGEPIQKPYAVKETGIVKPI